MHVVPHTPQHDEHDCCQIQLLTQAEEGYCREIPAAAAAGVAVAAAGVAAAAAQVWQQQQVWWQQHRCGSRALAEDRFTAQVITDAAEPIWQQENKPCT